VDSLTSWAYPNGGDSSRTFLAETRQPHAVRSGVRDGIRTYAH